VLLVGLCSLRRLVLWCLAWPDPLACAVSMKELKFLEQMKQKVPWNERRRFALRRIATALTPLGLQQFFKKSGFQGTRSDRARRLAQPVGKLFYR